MKEQVKQKAHTALANTAKIGLGMVLGVLLGMGIREHQLLNSTITYNAVYVQEQFNNMHFIMQPQFMTGIDSDLCKGSSVDWKKGETLKDWTFEQQQGCKRVISYHRYRKGEELNASIQIR